MSWGRVGLSLVAEVFNGKTPSKSEQRDEGFPVLKIKDVDEDLKFKGEFQSFVDSDFYEKNKAKKIRLYDSLILNAAHNSEYVGSKQYCAEKEVVDSIATGEWLICRARREVLDAKYLNFWLRSESARFDMKGLVKGIHLYPKDVAQLEIPLPPLETQKQIAAILEKAEQLRKDCQQMEQELNNLAQSVFMDMFGDPVSNPKGWEVRLLGEFASIQLGKMLSEKSKQGANPKKYLRNANVQWRRIDMGDLLEMDFNDNEIKKFELLDNDLLVCEGGEIGRCAIWRSQLVDCYYQKALHRVRLDSDMATPEYIQEYFYWMAAMGGLSGSVNEVTFKHLTAEKMNKLKVPLPPVSVQKKYSEFYRSVFQRVECNNVLARELDANFKTVMKKAFNGELITKNKAA